VALAVDDPRHHLPTEPRSTHTHMFSNTAHLLGTAAMAYGVIAALTAVLQVRQMISRRASCDVSARFFSTYAGGYLIWLLYGLTIGSLPLIVVDTIGLICGALVLTVVLALRGSLLHPTTWSSCGTSHN
jgi:uncharacterized protein with PQ loop repeat